MLDLENKDVAVVGLGSTGQAVARLLRARGARVHGLDPADTADLRQAARDLRRAGVAVRLGAVKPPAPSLDLAVIGPEVPHHSPLVRTLLARGVPCLSDTEVCFELAQCLPLAVAGTHGKRTVAALIHRILEHAQRRTRLAGGTAGAACAAVPYTRDLDHLVLTVTAPELEFTRSFRPVVAVLLNLAPGDREPGVPAAVHARTVGRLFANQQVFDWAIVQSDALAQLLEAGVTVPSKIVTFSAQHRRADLYLDRRLLISQIADWCGPLLDLDRARLLGPHNAENVMAALAVGRVLRVPLEVMREAVTGFAPLPGRCEVLGDWQGVGFVHDGQSRTPYATQQAIASLPAHEPGEPNVLLVAGGHDRGLEYHDLGPLLARRVRRAVLFGDAASRLRAAWGLFTPCSVVGSLLEAVEFAVSQANAGDIVLFSPACSVPDMSPDDQQGGDVFREAFRRRVAATGGGPPAAPTADGRRGDRSAGDPNPALPLDNGQPDPDFPCGGLREPRGEQPPPNSVRAPEAAGNPPL